MKIVLGQAYFLHLDPKLDDAGQPYPPLGPLLLAAMLRDAGHEVVVFDSMLAGDVAEWARLLDAERPDRAVLFEDNFNYLSKMCLESMRKAALIMVRAARDRSIEVIVAGSDASDHESLYLEAGADVVARGEADQAIVEVMAVEHLTPGVLAEIDGLAFDGPAGVQRTGPRSNLKALDELPFAARDLADIDAYRTKWLERHGRFSLNMVTTRGCPYHCNWCAKPIWGQRYNARSPENVVAEMVEVSRRYKPDHIWFADDIFGLKPGWINRFADLLTEEPDLLTEEKVRLPFKCLSRPDLLVKPGTVAALSRAGCETVWIGAESGSQKVLDAMEKGTRVDQIHQAADLVHEAGFEIGFFIQFGYPGEGLPDIEATFDLIRSAAPDDIGVSVSYPLPGTPFHQRVMSTLGTRTNWSDSADLAMLYEGPFPTEFYRQLHRVLHLEFRSRHVIRSARSARRLPAGRDLAGLAQNAVRLPFARRRLARMVRAAKPAAGLLPVALSPAEAARPTEQRVALGTRNAP